MFGFFEKKSKVFAPFDGKVVPLEEVPDDAFSKKIVGDGLAIIPESNELVAPFDGKIEQIFDTKHAFVLCSSDGLQILVHIGINTVNLKGGGFDIKIPSGREIKIGDVIAEVNFDFVAKNGYSIYTPLIFMNLENFKVDFRFGNVKSGKDLIAVYKK